MLIRAEFLYWPRVWAKKRVIWLLNLRPRAFLKDWWWRLVRNHQTRCPVRRPQRCNRAVWMDGKTWVIRGSNLSPSTSLLNPLNSGERPPMTQVIPRQPTKVPTRYKSSSRPRTTIRSLYCLKFLQTLFRNNKWKKQSKDQLALTTNRRLSLSRRLCLLARALEMVAAPRRLVSRNHPLDHQLVQRNRANRPPTQVR